jgi:hemolysin activation/secretion protein
MTLAALLVSSVDAQNRLEPPSAETLGPQSGLETYDAPLAPFDQQGGEIDFPALINAPGANDDAVVTESLRGLRLEILGTEGTRRLDDFITILGTSRTGPDRDGLYAALAESLGVYRDLPLTLGELRFLQQDIADVYRAEGFPLMSVVVPPQEVTGGVVTVQINEFRLRAYRVQFGTGGGSYAAEAPHWTSEERLGALLDPLLEEPVLRRDSLDTKVKFLNANPSRSARVVFEPGEIQGESIAVIQIDEQRRWGLQAGYNNHATENSGTHRFSLGGYFTNVLLENHQLSWNATFGTKIDEFQNYSLIYMIPTISGQRLTANLNYSDTASSPVPPVGSASTTLQLSLKYDQPILTREKWDWKLGVQTAFKQFERESLFGGTTVAGAEFDAFQLVLNNTFNLKERTATNQFVVGLAFAFEGITGANSDAHFREFYNYSNGGAETQHLIVNYARVQQLGPLIGVLENWSTETQLSWQVTTDRLGGSDTFALGGPTILRAYEASEAFGDSGFYAVQMLHFPPLQGDALGPFAYFGIQQLRVSGFFEYGKGDPRYGDEVELWDAGFQVSLAGVGNFQATASLAFAGEETTRTQVGDAHFYISVMAKY